MPYIGYVEIAILSIGVLIAKEPLTIAGDKVGQPCTIGSNVFVQLNEKLSGGLLESTTYSDGNKLVWNNVLALNRKKTLFIVYVSLERNQFLFQIEAKMTVCSPRLLFENHWVLMMVVPPDLVIIQTLSAMNNGLVDICVFYERN